MTTPSDASQAVELPPLPAFTCDATTGHVMIRKDEDLIAWGQAIAQDRAARAQAEPVAWREALQDALEFIEHYSHAWNGVSAKHPNTIATNARAALAALHPQPAPAVAVEAERELFERQLRQRGYHYFDGKLMGPSQAAVWEFMSAGTEHAWQGWLAARSAPAVAESQWRPIESAPKDGTAIYVVVSDALKPEAGVAHWFSDTWRGGTDIDWQGTENPHEHFGVYPSPTHWQPLPAPPTVGSGSAQEGQAK